MSSSSCTASVFSLLQLRQYAVLLSWLCCLAESNNCVIGRLLEGFSQHCLLSSGDKSGNCGSHNYAVYEVGCRCQQALAVSKAVRIDLCVCKAGVLRGRTKRTD